jgi:hypothetical protein
MGRAGDSRPPGSARNQQSFVVENKGVLGTRTAREHFFFATHLAVGCDPGELFSE